MPALKNAKHERFAQLLAKGSTADDAYSEAGYTPDRKNAARLTTNDGVRTRLRELQERAAMKVEMTVADIVRQLAEDRDFARECGSAAAAVSASLGQAKVLGLVVERQAIGGDPAGAPIRSEVDLSRLSAVQLQALAGIRLSGE